MGENTLMSAAGAGQCALIISLDTKPTPPSQTSGGYFHCQRRS